MNENESSKHRYDVIWPISTHTIMIHISISIFVNFFDIPSYYTTEYINQIWNQLRRNSFIGGLVHINIGI